MVEFQCDCGGIIDCVEDTWIQENDKLIKNDLVCRECKKEFSVVYSFDKLVCKTCGHEIDYCECSGPDWENDE